jgi:hypothetical protein
MFDRDRREGVLMIIGFVVVLAVCAFFYFSGDRETTGDSNYQPVAAGASKEDSAPDASPTGPAHKTDDNVPSMSASLAPMSPGASPGSSPRRKESGIVPDSMIDHGH